MEHNNYGQITVSSLKNLARERGIMRNSRLNKSEFIKKLREPTPPREPTREELRQLARENEVYVDTLGLIKNSVMMIIR